MVTFADAREATAGGATSSSAEPAEFDPYNPNNIDLSITGPERRLFVMLKGRFNDACHVNRSYKKIDQELYFMKLYETLSAGDNEEIDMLVEIVRNHSPSDGPNIFFHYYNDEERREDCEAFINWVIKGGTTP